jgi:sigma-E factor negative regulatory protein RseB
MSARVARAGAWPLALLVSLVGAVLLFPTSSAVASDNPDALLARARTAASTHDFVGIVEIRWRTPQGTKSSDVPVSGDQGLVEVGLGSDMVVGHGLDRWAGADGASTLWHDAGPDQLPKPSTKWNLSTAAGPVIVGRPTTVIVARDHDGRVRARLSVDRSTGLLLRREVLDAKGRTVHEVTFVALSTVDKTAPDGTTPTTPQAVHERGSDQVKQLPSGITAPTAAGDGFRLVGRYKQGSGVYQLFYSDGLFNVSVFEQRGELDWGSLPSGGTDTTVSDQRTLAYETAAGTVMFWNVSGSVYTCISDAPADAVTGIVATFANASDDSDPIHDAIHFVLGPFSWG